MADFDSGDIASGLFMVPKTITAPERVVSPDQTRALETLLAALETAVEESE